MRFIFRYLGQHRGMILMQLSFVIIFAVIFRLYHLPSAAVLYPALVCFLIGGLFACRSMYMAYQKHKKLTALCSLPAHVLMDSMEEKCRTSEEEDYQRIIQKLCLEMQQLNDHMADSYHEMTEYFTMWVHQIKTPITSMWLYLEPEDTKLSRRIMSDLLRIEQYVEMVLTYVKMGSESTDYVFRTVDIDQILRENIRRLRGDFIMKKLKLVFIPSGKMVVSDEKWLSFVIGQVLSNALKYTSEGSVTVSVEEPDTLCICDTGIGIAAEDIPRIFEKGYTGGNGRAFKRASGLGLYLCRQICDRLGHTISITSEVEKGTTVRIGLGRENFAYRENETGNHSSFNGVNRKGE